MNEYRTELKEILLLNDLTTLEERIKNTVKSINETDLASFFIDCIYLKSVVELIVGEHWMQSKNSPTEILFERFIKKFFSAELKPLLYLHSFFLDSNISQITGLTKALILIESALVTHVKTKNYDFQKNFLKSALQKMSELYELEHQINSDEDKNPQAGKMSLYRSLDSIDQIFELDYLLNEVPSITEKERLFEGAGAGVQSSFATTVLALRYLNLAKGSRFIDLGSGYGRIGLVVGLMRPDIQFTGYEFVKERVDIANKASHNLGLDKHVHFVAQNLASEGFKVPFADTYYIFDALSDESYGIIMPQLQDLTYKHRITVVTKGNSKHWMNTKFWSGPQEFNDGNLCIFRSRAMPKGN